MIRKFFAKFNQSVSKRVVAPRREVSVPVRIAIEADRTGGLRTPTQTATLRGETRDLSKTGISLILSAIRIDNSYLVGEGRRLNAELDLPGGKVKMIIVGQRHEQVGIHSSVSQFLVGAQIVKMEEHDREIYEDFLRHGMKSGGKVLQLKTGES